MAGVHQPSGDDHKAVDINTLLIAAERRLACSKKSARVAKDEVRQLRRMERAARRRGVSRMARKTSRVGLALVSTIAFTTSVVLFVQGDDSAADMLSAAAATCGLALAISRDV